MVERLQESLLSLGCFKEGEENCNKLKDCSVQQRAINEKERRRWIMACFQEREKKKKSLNIVEERSRM